MRRALVTGAAGFAGQWLCRELLHRGIEVTGTTVDADLPAGALDAVQRAHGRRGATATCGASTDLRERARRGAARPGLPSRRRRLRAGGGRRSRRGGGHQHRRRGAPARRAPRAARGGDARSGGGRRRERRAVRPPRRAPSCRSRESAAQRPLSVYAASKAAQEVIALEAHRSAGLRVIAARAFNHSGPGQSAQFLLPALVGRALAAQGVARARRSRSGTPRRCATSCTRPTSRAPTSCSPSRARRARRTTSRAGRAPTWPRSRGWCSRASAPTAELVAGSGAAAPGGRAGAGGRSRQADAAPRGGRPERTLDSLIDELLHAAPR